jgi:prepilin-type N-terminal cleavage/methylation domain-containing protein
MRRTLHTHGGFTLVELIISVGLFATVMLLASGSYLMMINLNRQTQNIATGIDNLSFAFETMTRTIRTGSNYSCGIVPGAGDCASGGSAFTFTDENGHTITYSLSGTAIQRKDNGVTSDMTDASVSINALTFYTVGSKAAGAPGGDLTQAHVTIVVSGSVSSGGKAPQTFHVETGATMRGSDI